MSLWQPQHFEAWSPLVARTSRSSPSKVEWTDIQRTNAQLSLQCAVHTGYNHGHPQYCSVSSWACFLCLSGQRGAAIQILWSSLWTWISITIGKIDVPLCLWSRSSICASWRWRTPRHTSTGHDLGGCQRCLLLRCPIEFATWLELSKFYKVLGVNCVFCHRLALFWPKRTLNARSFAIA